MVLLTSRQFQDSDASERQAAGSNGQLDAVIGAAAAGSIALILAAIFLGYWLMKRRAHKQSAPSRMFINESRLTLEAPRKARRRSLILSVGTTLVRSSPPIFEKPLPSPPATASLSSSDEFTHTPMIATFSHSEYAEKSPGFFEDASLTTLSPPPPTRAKLGLVRMISVKRPDPIDVKRAQAFVVEQAVDSGLRLVDPVVVPPPYTPR